MTGRPLILASTSVHRQALLREAGIAFTAHPSRADEKHIRTGTPVRLAQMRALAKGIEVAERFPGHVIIGADQTLSHDGTTFDKAVDRSEAFARLSQLQGKTHYLHSAYCLIAGEASQQTRIILERVVTIPMTMRALSDQEINAYLDTDEWRGCVGCYQAENRGSDLITSSREHLSAIVGLPIPELASDLQSLT